MVANCTAAVAIIVTDEMIATFCIRCAVELYLTKVLLCIDDGIPGDVAAAALALSQIEEEAALQEQKR